MWELLFQIFRAYLSLFICLTLLSLSLALLGITLEIRKTSVKWLLMLFEKVSRDSNKGKCKDENSSDDESGEFLSNQGLIKRDASESIFRKMSEMPVRSKTYTVLDDSLEFIKAGMEAIIEDDVTCRFTNEQLQAWNLLTRTSYGRPYNSFSVTAFWLCGFLIRYLFLFPMRFVIFLFGMVLLITSTASIGFIRNDRIRQTIYIHVSLMSYRVLSRALSVLVTYHNSENKAKPGSICVANHTSPLDVQVLSMDNCYALVGQKHGGLLGLIQDCLSRASSHVWFERSEANDRMSVRERLQQHVSKKTNMPILIFPEGTCINNTSIMMFKKGSFEIEGAVVYPVAIRYDARLGDAFWNSSKMSYFNYVMELMSSWATVVDIWYLPPLKREPDEDGMRFAARVKHLIADASGLIELDWDGQLKRYPVKQEAVEQQRKRWGRRVNRALSFESPITAAIISDGNFTN